MYKLVQKYKIKRMKDIIENNVQQTTSKGLIYKKMQQRIYNIFSLYFL